MNGRSTRIITALLALFGSIQDADAAPLKVQVRGTATLTARASRDNPTGGDSDLVLSGALTDDAGQALASQRVSVRVARAAVPHDEQVVEALRAPRGCDARRDRAWGVQAGEGNEVVVITDEDGRFCFRVRLKADRYKASLAYAPAEASLVDGIEQELTFDLSRQSLTLRFDPIPRIAPLDAPRVTVEAVAIVDDDAEPRAAPALELVLANESGELSRAATDTFGRARFVVPGPMLGPPGPGELRVTFAGDADTAWATRAEAIERRLTVVVTVPAADRGELAAAVPEDGIPLTAEVTSSLGPLDEGTVEARVGDVIVGAAPVSRGVARLSMTFTGQGDEALVRLRYVPASPWYTPLGEPTIRVPIREPSLLSKAPVLLAGLAMTALFLVGRVSGQRRKPEPVTSKASGEAKPRVDVVRLAARAEGGWLGRVVDAHEATPVRGARVWIERGTFEGRETLASVETDADGRFALPSIGDGVGGVSIVVEAPLHARLAQDLPPPGELVIAVAQRRRALLAKLVTWARRRGPPFDARPEPTPGHVRRSASDEETTARWAQAIEQAAFGPDDVDARVEAAIEHLAPKDVGPPRAG